MAALYRIEVALGRVSHGYKNNMLNQLLAGFVFHRNRYSASVHGRVILWKGKQLKIDSFAACPEFAA